MFSENPYKIPTKNSTKSKCLKHSDDRQIVTIKAVDIWGIFLYCGQGKNRTKKR